MSYVVVAVVAVVIYVFRAEIWAYVSGAAAEVVKDDTEE